MPTMQPDLASKVKALRGPILVLGASGAVGSKLLRLLVEHRQDAFGAVLTQPAPPLEGVAAKHLQAGDLRLPQNLEALLDHVQPAVVFDCLSASGDAAEIYETNVALKARLMGTLRQRNVSCYVHSSGAGESCDVAASQAAAAGLIRHFGKSLGMPCANLQFASTLPSAEAFVDTALNLQPGSYGDSFVIGPGAGARDEGVSAVIACYTEGPTIPFMYERLVKVFEKLNIDYEIIFVDNGSIDNAQEVIQDLSRRSHRVIGLSLSRNFGSQAAFRSGMEMATKRAVILLDGDLQDPPELIEQFVEKWREGYDVVYGRRVKREGSLVMQAAYKLFYLLLNRMSYVYMPRDAGDFSLMDRKVVRWILECKERDLFIRGLRAFVGFRQVGVDYHRPERLIGKSNLNFLNNLGWAKKGILSFSNVPLTMLTTAGVLLFLASMGIGFLHVLAKLLFPQIAPQGITTVVVLILGLGSLNLLAISIVGEYIAKIFEEVKGRPPYIRMSIIQNGEIRPASSQ